ncbi:MAG: extracellular solute-binding protein [Candidatus Phytoplasma stylosanthis]|uniref:extracellular solute-binding protein n=1 Tax=Candidatus Phytoplasma stylosanthis TaxID=2798314 RepID=UPI00293B3944|nr:extracellular solute-binding protein [Candidatus Phytoplasma stylosanthis]MDV3167910.1 extracellular solute-binding protein [Candidatus Phytoplasma stylosanthis]MDV3170745.1 extracellular solute-binding protein [Candidatus Phytoplasma stylosanthis]MDV3173611.1 extracellular solute-binding protein [Candidatus Phytoplasma stylosanthis]MDV3174002.1 extracellular solute-binding protein [Candidatus Phytoplasma stylosanthis]MDV3202586.1 extracellular solute-binding protein [Candidatus Phytoplasma
MQKKIALIIIFFVIITFSIVIYKNVKTKTNKKKDIILFNWGEYIDSEIINNFNKESQKFNVKQMFFSSNELAINKIKSGNKYDIAILSEYAIEQLLQNNNLEKIKNINALLKIKNIFTNEFEQIKKKRDNNNNIWEYIIPYFWGKIGILYRKDKLDREKIINLEKTIKNPEYKIALYNNPFEVIFLGLKITGGDISVNSQEEIKKAKEALIEIKKINTNLSFITDQLLDRMKTKNKEYYDIVVAYSGDARYLMKQNDNLDYYQFDQDSDSKKIKKGTNIWFDALVLPKGSDQEGAYEFIKFLLKPENIKRNKSFINYDTPYIQENEYYPNELQLKIIDEDKIYKYNEKNKKQINDAWNEIYTYPSYKDKYLILLSFIIWILFYLIYIIMKK